MRARLLLLCTLASVINGSSLLSCTNAQCLRQSDCPLDYVCSRGLCSYTGPRSEAGVTIIYIDDDASTDIGDASEATEPESVNDGGDTESVADLDASERNKLDASVDSSTDTSQ